MTHSITAWSHDGKTVVKHTGFFKPHEIVDWKESFKFDKNKESDDEKR